MNEHLFVTTSEGEHRLPFSPGLSIREILDATKLRVRSSCGGIGACGQCRVRIDQGEVTSPTTTEMNRLGPELIEQRFRLACQVRPIQGVRISMENPAPPSNWQAINDLDTLPQASVSAGERRPARHGYGVAVDLGTTQIRVSLLDLATGKRLAGRSGLNPQALFGADVLTRLLAASESAQRALEIGRLAVDAIGEALCDITSREDIALHSINHLMVVGNTAMLCLLAAKNHGLLLLPDHWMQSIDCLPQATAEWCKAWGLAAATPVELVPPLAGFVGSDLLAGVLATGLTTGPVGAMLIDFGTNSEMALWDGEVVWVTSAAGGPAFEGCGISCGMPAAPGAIYRAVMNGDNPAEFLFSVLGGGQAQGVCGSGLVDIIASLLRMGKLKKNGRLCPSIADRGVGLFQGEVPLALKGQDIDALQRAKAAIGAGVQCLLEQAGMRLDDLQRLCVCGAFGRYLDITNAQDIGLLPAIPAAAIELCGNTALAGCERLLLSDDVKTVLQPLQHKCRSANLSLVSEFEDLFVENLYLQPMRSK